MNPVEGALTLELKGDVAGILAIADTAKPDRGLDLNHRLPGYEKAGRRLRSLARLLVCGHCRTFADHMGMTAPIVE